VKLRTSLLPSLSNRSIEQRPALRESDDGALHRQSICVPTSTGTLQCLVGREPPHRAKVLLSGISDPATLEYSAQLLGDEEVMQASFTRGEHGEHSTTEPTGYRSLAPAHVLRGVRPGEGMLVYGHLPAARLTLRTA
jgi:hypothetical protein